MDTRQLQQIVGETNGKNGFNEYPNLPEEHRMHYLGSKLMLVAGELGEAQEEIRNGHAADETYFKQDIPESLLIDTGNRGAAIQAMKDHGHWNPKPEGFPVELADAVIRIFGIAYEAGIDLTEAIETKIAYNSTRPFRHGKNF